MRKFLGILLLCVLFGSSFFVSAKGGPVEVVPNIPGNTDSNANDNTSQENQGACDPEKDIMLNTNIPFLGRCIRKDPESGTTETTSGNVFQKLMAVLTKIVMAVLIVVGFMAILVGGFMITAGGVKADLVSKGKGLIIKVIAGLALVGISGIILNLINPNFFKTGGMIVVSVSKRVSE